MCKKGCKTCYHNDACLFRKRCESYMPKSLGAEYDAVYKQIESERLDYYKEWHEYIKDFNNYEY